MDVSRSAWVSALLLLFGLGGCANFETIQRSTTVPWNKTNTVGKGTGLAVHLDAQQRLVVFAAERYCAEPSPDALAAYAAALGLSASALPSKSGALSAAMNSVAGSIGLRTQSITLMRDTLYRICEERLNNSLSDEQVAVLLSRSQDLTAVILAIEQLTGAVVAPPVTLSTGGGASALASLTANTKALNDAETAEQKFKDDSDKANTKQQTAQTDYDQAYAVLTQLQQATPPDSGKVADQIGVVKGKDAVLQQAKTDAQTAAGAYDRMHETTELIKQARDAASAIITATVTSGAQVGSVAGRNISDAAIASVSTTVDLLVTELLQKDYFMDTCLAVLTSQGSREALQTFQEVRQTMQLDSAKKPLSVPSTNAEALATRLQISQGRLIDTCLTYLAKLEPRPYVPPKLPVIPPPTTGTPPPPDIPPKTGGGTSH